MSKLDAALGAFGRLLAWWTQRNLFFRFSIIFFFSSLVAMLVIGAWQSRLMIESVVRNAAIEAALYCDGFIEPAVQELKHADRLSDGARRVLDGLLKPHAAGNRVLGLRIWKGDLIVYSDQASLIGRTFPRTARRDAAWQGNVSGEYKLTGDDASPASGGGRFLEIYAPVRETGTDRVLAIAETYHTAEQLDHDIIDARTKLWLMLAAVTAVGGIPIQSRARRQPGD